MSARQTPLGFGVEDLLQRIIPGGLLALMFLLPGYIGNPYFQGVSIANNFAIAIGAFALISIVTGEGIDITRRTIYPVPVLFSRIVYEVTGERESLNVIQRWRLRSSERISRVRWAGAFLARRVWKERFPRFEWSINEQGEIVESPESAGEDILDRWRTELGSSSELTNSRLLYRSLLIQLDGGMSSETRRYRTVYRSYQNVQLTFILSVVIVTTYMLNVFTGGDPQQAASAVLLWIPFLCIFVGFWLVYDFTRPDIQYIESLFLDYVLSGRSTGMGDAE